ncbi:response regulator [Butyrivibrio sp. VCB2006]|uniref:response regulator n=1 Tax=Butyrivibrio sp. VCB2006 TaxID=1280679 RepID=UPI000404A5CA|nr:response regulator [Butyrivibrio sp. VCB2006]
MVSNRNVLFISSQETFSVHGMETKLKEMGYTSLYVPLEIKQLQEHADKGELIVYYMDETVSDDPAFLVFLKDLCMEKDKGLILIGAKEEYNVVVKTVPLDCVSAWFERPLDMRKFLQAVEKQFDSMAETLLRKTILIIDDDVAYMQTIREWLKESYQVAMVDSGVKAIKWLAINKADLVLLDYEMPITNGPQIFEMLKSDSDTGVIPVMFLTGQQSKESVLTAMKLKPVDYLLKTINKAQLKEKLDQYFAIQKGKL